MTASGSVSSDEVLRVEELTIALPPGADRAHAVERVSFGIGAGETVCVVGESGSGKSMLAKALLVDVDPTARWATALAGSLAREPRAPSEPAASHRPSRFRRSRPDVVVAAGPAPAPDGRPG